MAYTKFGEYVRILRIKNHQVMGDMAKILETSLPFLSAVENGKKSVPSAWVKKLQENYDLSENETSELMSAIEESKIQMKIKLSDSSNSKRTAALQFARSFDNMDDETAEKIIKLLEGEKL